MRNIFDHVVNIDDSNPNWILQLNAGWDITFPPSVSHEKFENGDKISIGFENWGSGKGLAYLSQFRGKTIKLIQHFIFGEECKIKNPEDEVIYSGELMKVVLNDENDVTISHKQNENIGLIVYPLEAKNFGFLVGPTIDAMMVVTDTHHDGPKIKFVKEED